MSFDFRTFLKGMAMGAADVVPGVSGGTIAFISGIYDRLLESIRRINPSLVGVWRREGVAGAWNYINGTFLVTLLGGILTSIFTLARVITYLLANHPVPLWSFFFGLILISLVHIGRSIKGHGVGTLLSAAAGFGLAYIITVANPLTLEASYINFLLGGMLAICAMILPGISGSFILLLLGLYGPVLAAVKGFDLSIIVVFACGCALGLLSFSHLLSFLLRRFHGLTLAFLCGLMLGTLNKIWPWKEVLTWRTNSGGDRVPLLEQAISPWHYEALTGASAQIPMALLCAAAGIGLVWGLERFAARTQ
ncbi:DUF368 domain-containing protein [Ferrimonas balearica]|uniref:DUF368 domain-containing protein n=1 Tax=Ferrimonas balearica TaxID=44012 RepID=UPI001C998786|nr:DUF368 domain-containing protein [Ferrimonas balearica]MBY5922255.1 DUF368 domain-containing protein [Ferrimonas balearica]MBY5994405.1 DUF368 domain-containing protein [Ferrimonas balearica]